MYRKKYQIHFVGIGGIGMSGIAELRISFHMVDCTRYGESEPIEE